MKNAVLILLIIALAVMATLFFYQKPKTIQVVKVTNSRKDHNGNPVNTEDCPIRTGPNKTCIIPISYLTDMTSGGTDTAIEVHRKDIIKWIGDNGETIDVQPMSGMVCSDHTKPDPPQGDPSLIGPVTSVGTGNIQYAQVTENPKNDLYCYKTNIKVTLNGQTTVIDPHIFDGGP